MKKYMIIVSVLAVLLVIIIVLFRMLSLQNNNIRPVKYIINPVLTKTVNDKLCDFTLKLPDGYYYQNPINSFYGYQTDGQTCVVILGPNYKNNYEGFYGEQIQINEYYTRTKTVDQLINYCCNYIKQTWNGEGSKYESASYGGKNQNLIIKKEKVIYEIIWRNQPNNIDNVIKEISQQLPN